ncbi:copper amine oxidase N-terminal domain-containing protein [Paenibacillus filicis]|uniref:Copper amine oxidase N-terminal domain-containing protein n=1 Tax=Paenibacillus gyeongsangnamensis TaxID=3388067 RepID=A0ABT4QC43_9BACL|nr:copper amine oxidase N-terminal domain-containing protein [Paenibacillus filicis]MCZ8514436.1 copper amine oxidase N-terminal domain-containing protein [Paenibacillus filicis]
MPINLRRKDSAVRGAADSEEGTTLVPFRPVFEKLGLTVAGTVPRKPLRERRKGWRSSLVIDDPDAYVNDQLNRLELAPRLVGGNTLVPVRFVSEASGKDVVWDLKATSIFIQPRASRSSAILRTTPWTDSFRITIRRARSCPSANMWGCADP